MPTSTWALAALVVVTLAPVVVATIAGARTSWTPSGDRALLLLRMHDVGGAHTPATGAFSRFGWNHPGPLLFWFGALPLRLFGASGVLVATGILNGASIFAAIAAARRLGGDALAGLVTVAAAVLVHAHGAAKLIDPWNPWAAMLPLLCFLCSAACFAETGRRWALAVAVLSGSFAAQAHLGTVPVVAGAAAFVAVWSRRSRPHGRWLLVALVLGLGVLWSGPIADQVSGSGNAHSILRFALDPDQVKPPAAVSLGAAAREMGLRPAWSGAPETGFLPLVVPAPRAELLLLPLALGVVMIGAFARGHRRLAHLAGFALALVGLSVFAISRTVDDLFPYVIRWIWPVALLGTVTFLWGAWRGLPDRIRSRPAAALAIAGGSTIVVVASVASISVLSAGPLRPSPRADQAAAAISSIVADRLPKGSYEPVAIDPTEFSAASMGAFAQLERDGWKLHHPKSDAFILGAWRTERRGEAPQLIVVSKSATPNWTPPPEARRIGRWDPLDPAERARVRRVTAEVLRAVGDNGRTGPTAVADALLELTVAHRRTALVAEVSAIAPSEIYEIWLAPPAD